MKARFQRRVIVKPATETNVRNLGGAHGNLKECCHQIAVCVFQVLHLKTLKLESDISHGNDLCEKDEGDLESAGPTSENKVWA